MNLLVFGNEDFSFDNGAIRLISYLQQRLPEMNVQRLSRPEQLLDFIGTEFIILDVAAGIDSPVVITDVDAISYRRKVTSHDMDMSAFLKILKEVGRLGGATIVAIPNDRDPNEFKEEIVRLIQNVPVNSRENYLH